ncbi:unnamed protein product [Effrenium voratum]|uniref:Sulfotransferase n=1 Tax=Effrenium voratum TaxID=2562239 RepID=A0AA36IMK8_9DINO|nr:unnamed protein product [Effrenium voratum]
MARLLFFLLALVCPGAAEWEDLSMSMLQVEKSIVKQPWELRNFTGVCFHKTGTFLLKELVFRVMKTMGAPFAKFGYVIVPTYGISLHYNAPFKVIDDMYTLEEADRDERERTPRVVGFVRDPAVMVASAYCYHKRGEEPNNVEFNPPGMAGWLLNASVQEGLPYVALRMLRVTEAMVETFEKPRNSTIVVHYEELTGSAEGFDREVTRMLDWWFEGLTSIETRQTALEAARGADLNRHPEDIDQHSNPDSCEEETLRQMDRLLPADLLETYRPISVRRSGRSMEAKVKFLRDFQKRMGYPATI